MGGENFSLRGTSPGCTVVIVVVVVDANVEWDGATSSVGKKSGTNFALKKWKRTEKWRWDDRKILIFEESENGEKKRIADFQFRWMPHYEDCKMYTFNKY